MIALIFLVLASGDTLTATQRAEAEAIGSELRCPVCQGMPISDSPARMARDMMAQVQTLVGQGKSRRAIIDFFKERYGQWVHLKPSAQGIGVLVWGLPVLAGLGALVWFVRRRKDEIPTAEAPDEPRDQDLLTRARRELEL